MATRDAVHAGLVEIFRQEGHALLQQPLHRIGGAIAQHTDELRLDAILVEDHVVAISIFSGIGDAARALNTGPRRPEHTTRLRCRAAKLAGRIEQQHPRAFGLGHQGRRHAGAAAAYHDDIVTLVHVCLLHRPDQP